MIYVKRKIKIAKVIILSGFRQFFRDHLIKPSVTTKQMGQQLERNDPRNERHAM